MFKCWSVIISLTIEWKARSIMLIIKLWCILSVCPIKVCFLYIERNVNIQCKVYFWKKKNEIKEFNVYDIRKKKEESERIKAIRAEQRLAAEKEEDDDDEEDEEDSKPRKKKSKKPKEEVRNWNLGVSQNTRSYSPMCTLYS